MKNSDNHKKNQKSKNISESERALLDIFQAMNSLIFEIDYTGKYLNFAPTGYKLRDKTSSKALGKTIHDIFPKEQADLFLSFVQNCIDKNIADTIEYEIDVDGKTTWFEGKASPKTKNSILFIATDISIRKKEQAALYENKEHFQKLFNVLPFGAEIVDLKGFITDCNENSAKMLGYEVNELIGQHITHFVDKNTLEEFRAHFPKAIQGETLHLDTQMISKKGEKLALLRTAQPLFNALGEITNILTLSVDISGRKKLELELRKNENKFRLLSESTSDWEYWLDTDGNYKYISPSVERITGYTQTDFIENPNLLFEITLAEYSNKIKSHYHSETQKYFEEFSLEFPIKTKQGELRWLEHNCKAIIDENGNYSGRRGNNRDITLRKQTQEKLDYNQDLLGKAQEIGQIGTWEIDLRDNTIIWTDNCYTIFDQPLNSKITYSSFIDMIYPEDREFVDKKWKAALKNGTYDIEHRILVNNKIKWVKEKAEIEFDTNNKAIKAIGFAQDITKIKLTGLALAQSEEKYRLLAENIADVIWVYNISYKKFTYISPSVFQMRGYTVDEALQLSYTASLSPESEEKIKRVTPVRLKEFQSGISKTYTDELQQKHKDGHYIWVEIVTTPRLTKDGSVELLGVSRNITERKVAEKEIKKLSSAVEQSANSIIITNLEGVIEYINPKVTELTGYTLKEAIGQKTSILKSGEQSDDYYKQMWETICKGKDWSGEFHNKAKDGSLFWEKATISPLRDEQGKLSHFLAVKEDISDFKIKEKELIESEEKYRLMIETSNDLIWTLDTQGKISFFNKKVEEATGYFLEDWKGKSFAPLVLKKELDPLYQVVEKALKGISSSYTFKLKIANGKTLTLSVNTAPTYKNNQIDGMFSFARDITPEIEAKEALKKSEELYRLLAENTLDLIWILDLEFNPLYVNPAINSVLGYSEEEFRTLPLDQFINPEDIEKANNLKNKIIAEAKPSDKKKYTLQLKHKRKDEKIINVELSLVPTFDKKGKVIGFQGRTVDISERKRNELIQKILFNISKSVVTPNSLEEFLSFLKTELNQLVDTTNFYIALYDAKSNYLSLPFINDEYDNFDSFPAKKTLTYYVIKTQKALLATKETFKKLEAAGEIKPYGTDPEVWLGIPLQTKGKVTGAMVLQSYSNKNAYTQADMEMLQFIGDQISIFIDQKRADEKIAESDERFNLAMKASKDGLYDWNLITNEIYYSASWKEMLGYFNDELPNDIIIWENLSHPGERDRSLEILRKAIEQKTENYDVEFRMKHKLGYWVHILSRAQIIYNDNGVAIRAVGTHVDLTEQKRAEQEILKAKEQAEENENRLNTFINSIPDIVCFKDGEGKWLLANDADLKLFNLENVDYLHKTDKDLAENTNEIYREAFLSCMISDEEAWKKKKMSKGIEIIPTIKGKNKIYDIIKIPVFNKDNSRKGLAVIGRDITELHHTQNNLILAKEKAEESDRLKSAFLANMSHEIRTPMNGILGFSGLLKEPGLSGDEQQEYIAVIERGGKRMLNIINDLIDISKIEAGLVDITISNINTKEITDYFYRFFKPETDSKGLQFIVSNTSRATEIAIKSDKEKVYAILTNLIKNAIKYTNTGHIEFGCESQENRIKFFVKDTGIGIPDNRIDAVFDRFVQADIEDRDAREGAGLGLSISKAYAEMLGAEIWVDSVEGEGTQFYFTLSNFK